MLQRGSYVGKLKKLKVDFVKHKKKFNQPCDYFIFFMNELARKLGMRDTQYFNPSGITFQNGLDKANKSTALDQLILCKKVLKDPLIEKIVKTKVYKCEIINLK